MSCGFTHRDWCTWTISTPVYPPTYQNLQVYNTRSVCAKCAMPDSKLFHCTLCVWVVYLCFVFTNVPRDVLRPFRYMCEHWQCDMLTLNKRLENYVRTRIHGFPSLVIFLQRTSTSLNEQFIFLV